VGTRPTTLIKMPFKSMIPGVLESAPRPKKVVNGRVEGRLTR
jgi:hypothetical protein